MARMWPSELPREIRQHPFRSSEVKVYERLRKELADDFRVFYSRPWLGLTATGEEIDGECDFLVAHPKLGMLALEVKGGSISYEPQSEQWSSTNRFGVKSRIKNPVSQARSAKHNLLAKLKETRKLGDRFIRARHGVVFPDCETPRQASLGPDMPARIFCCEREFSHAFSKWIVERMSSVDAREGGVQLDDLGIPGIVALEQMLASPFTLRIPLSKRLRESVEEVGVLTQRQAFILKAMAAIPRVAIAGPAGSGKTVLSIQEAIRLSELGFRTLWLCYNSQLAEHQRLVVSQRENLTISTFHELCGSMCSKAGIRIEHANGKEFFETTLPEAAMDALATSTDFAADAVVVDEGQDFMPLWWVVIDGLLEVGDRRYLRVFHDTNQTVYSGRHVEGDLPSDFVLTQNLRNTRQIFAEAKHLHSLPSGMCVESAGPEGVEVRRVHLQSLEELPSRVAEEAASLVVKEGLSPSEVGVLVSSQDMVERVRECIKVPPRPQSENSAPLLVDTIRRFKGLERPAIVVGVDGDVSASVELAYVALSRAIGLLILVGLPSDVAGLGPKAQRP